MYADSSTSELAELRKQVAALNAQMVTMEAQKSRTQNPLGSRGNFEKKWPTQVESNESGTSLTRPHQGYCFRCGEDGQIVALYENDPDPSKVARKQCLLGEKQAQRDLQNQVKSQQVNSRPFLQ